MHAAAYVPARGFSSSGAKEASQQFLVVTAGSDGQVYLWKRHACVGSFRADDAPLRSLAVRGHHFYTGSDSGVVRQFELASGNSGSIGGRHRSSSHGGRRGGSVGNGGDFDNGGMGLFVLCQSWALEEETRQLLKECGAAILASSSNTGRGRERQPAAGALSHHARLGKQGAHESLAATAARVGVAHLAVSGASNRTLIVGTRRGEVISSFSAHVKRCACIG
jgi:hypothetical protein